MRPAANENALEESLIEPLIGDASALPDTCYRPPRCVDVAPPMTGFGQADLSVLEAVLSQDAPMTVRQVVKLSKIEREHALPALSMLCELRLIHRLNTVVESYTARLQ